MASPSGAWVEVLRSAATNVDPVNYTCGPEGMREYGCWFLPAAGSGVWLHVGRTVAFANREQAAHAGYAPDGKLDCFYARTARARGFETMQLSTIFSNPHYAEIVHAGHSCMHQPAPLTSACPPKEIALRAGWRAALPCKCASRRQWLMAEACG